MGRRVDYLTGKQEFGKLVAGQFMETQVTTCFQESMADRVAVAITTGRFGSLPVVDEKRKLVGIISEFDLLKALRAGKDLAVISVKDVMTEKPICVSESASADDIMKVLEEHHFIRVPVVDGDGLVTGVVSRTDILKGYLQSNTGDIPWWM
ncbi:MAG: CBS domain-containing protein [Nitrospiria bacterium]